MSGERTCSPDAFFMNTKKYREIIRRFLDGVEWAGPRSVSILIHGHAGEYNWADTELAEMTATKRLPPIKRLISQHRIFAAPESRKKDKGEYHLEHDMKLRDVIAKFLFDRRYAGIDTLSVRRIAGNPDAHMNTKGNYAADNMIATDDKTDTAIPNVFFELDTGHEDDKELEMKITRYSGPGAFQVIFVMAHRYGFENLEEKRLEKLLQLGNKVLGHKPNRILGATYHGYLENGILRNLKGANPWMK